MISFTSDVHVPPPPDCRKRNDFSRPVARIDWGGAGSQKGGPFWTSPPYPSCKNPILWLKVDLLADLGVHRTPASPDSCYFVYLFIYLFILQLHAWLFLLSKSSIYPWAFNKNSLDFRGESILTPSPMPPLHNIHPVTVMVAVKSKLPYTLGPTLPELSILIECVGLLSMH